MAPSPLSVFVWIDSLSSEMATATSSKPLSPSIWPSLALLMLLELFPKPLSVSEGWWSTYCGTDAMLNTLHESLKGQPLYHSGITFLWCIFREMGVCPVALVGPPALLPASPLLPALQSKYREVPLRQAPQLFFNSEMFLYLKKFKHHLKKIEIHTIIAHIFVYSSMNFWHVYTLRQPPKSK